MYERKEKLNKLSKEQGFLVEDLICHIYDSSNPNSVWIEKGADKFTKPTMKERVLNTQETAERVLEIIGYWDD